MRCDIVAVCGKSLYDFLYEVVDKSGIHDDDDLDVKNHTQLNILDVVRSGSVLPTRDMRLVHLL
jgi:hypothetical protein